MAWKIVRWVSPLLLTLSCFLPVALAQSQGSSSDGDTSKTAALPYFVACVSTIIVMVIVCTPSRKR
jgi:hypothetical protein